MSAEHILKEYWGYDKFRPVQKEVIDAVISGKDTLALLPTGGGKSVCFQVPALMKDGVCLVISPLIALMKDQVENLRKRGVPAACIHSAMTTQELQGILADAGKGKIKFLYLSPERITTRLFLEFLPSCTCSLIAIDEAHCISQWGYDFRPSYLKIEKLRNHLPSVPVIALTASATPEVQQDICEKLGFSSPAIFRQSFERANLAYHVQNPESRHSALLEWIKKTNGSGIVYCRSRKRTVEIARLLQVHGITSDYYHAGLNAEERNNKQEHWIQNKTRIMACTNAFGMGIDKPDVRLVVHMDLPECLENYYQEAGRAGRDGAPADAVLFFDEQEISRLIQEAPVRYPSADKLRGIYSALMNHFQIPAGTGRGMEFDFDLNAFCDHFKLGLRETAFGMQLMGREELIDIRESGFKPSRIVFRTGKEQLTEYEDIHPERSDLIKTLLRTYEGIFDQPVAIREQQLSFLLRTDPETVAGQLRQLNSHGIIRYEPKNSKPAIQLLHDRMYRDDFKMDFQRIEKLRKQYLKRVSEIGKYCTNEMSCRSRIIADYFGEQIPSGCGICDNCIQKTRRKNTTADSGEVMNRILVSLSDSPLSRKRLQELVMPGSDDSFTDILNYLLGEERVIIDEFGLISLPEAKKKGPR